MNPSPWSKEAQLARSPGGNRKSKEAKAAKSKGIAFEKAVASELQATSKKPVRRNHQGREGGGLGNPDISALDGWHFEVKDEEIIRMPAYHKQVKQDCPPDQKPGIIYRGPVDGKPWVSIELDARMKFSVANLDAAGYDVVPRE